ncbi:MAG TPA: AMP-binding protein, partial [Verrucomicrobiae bacterium]|nr:AMP-binding protein [Verrucomicrobiae bacterium]
MYAVDWLWKRAELSPDKVAVIDAVGGMRLTYREMNKRADRLAAFLYHELGLREGERFAILAPNHLAHLDCLFAAQKLGVVLVPLNFRLTAGELEYVLRDSGPRILFYDTGMAELVKSIGGRANIEHFISLSGQDMQNQSYQEVLNQAFAGDFPRELRDLEAPWLILYTGGTTGFPKGAVLSQRMVTWNAVNTAVSWGLDSNDIAPIFTPFFHTGGLNVLTTPLIHLGGTVILTGAFAPGKAIKLISDEKATIVFMVPTMYQMIMQEPTFAAADWQSVKFCISGGAPCPQPIYEALWAKGLLFKQGYGLTEVGPNCFSLDSADMKRKVGSVGKPIFHSQIKLVDDGCCEVGVNEVGELAIRGNHLCSGYWQNEEATNAACRDGWFHTGDLATRDAEGYYYIVDRKKDMIISGGENIYPLEIETVL